MSEGAEFIQELRETYGQLRWIGLDEATLRHRAGSICYWVLHERATWEELGFTREDVEARLTDTLARKKQASEIMSLSEQ